MKISMRQNRELQRDMVNKLISFKIKQDWAIELCNPDK